MADSIGALWERTASKTGNLFMTGNIEINGQKIDIVVFRNYKDGNDKKPDWKILKNQPRDQEPPF